MLIKSASSASLFHVEHPVFHRAHLALTIAPAQLTCRYLLPNAIVGDTPNWPVLGFSTINAQFCTLPFSCSHRRHSILFHYAWVK
jgi:hypothetical protein